MPEDGAVLNYLVGRWIDSYDATYEVALDHCGWCCSVTTRKKGLEPCTERLIQLWYGEIWWGKEWTYKLSYIDSKSTDIRWVARGGKMFEWKRLGNPPERHELRLPSAERRATNCREPSAVTHVEEQEHGAPGCAAVLSPDTEKVDDADHVNWKCWVPQSLLPNLVMPNERFPIQIEEQLGTSMVESPVYRCGKAAYVRTEVVHAFFYGEWHEAVIRTKKVDSRGSLEVQWRSEGSVSILPKSHVALIEPLDMGVFADDLINALKTEDGFHFQERSYAHMDVLAVRRHD